MHSRFESISCLIRCHTVRRALEKRVHLKVRIRHWHAERQNKKCSLYLHINFGWDERRGGLLNFLSTFLFKSFFFISLLIHLYQLLKRVVFTQKVARGHTLMFFFPFPLYCVDEGMRFWKWILITAVKGFAYSASIGCRSLRSVCVWSELEIHTSVSKGSKFTVWSRTSVYTDTHIQLTTLTMAPVFLTQKSRVLMGPVSCFTCLQGNGH